MGQVWAPIFKNDMTWLVFGFIICFYKYCARVCWFFLLNICSVAIELTN